MTDYKASAVHVFRKFLAQELFATNVLKAGDYRINGIVDGITPVVPVQDIPEFADTLSDKTHIVYDLYTDIDEEQWWWQTDEVTLNIISQDLDKQYEIIEFLKDKFSKGDLSADAINAFAVAEGSPFRFQHFYLPEASISKASGKESGRISAPAVIVYTYRRVAS
jgi:hypothetical protein